GFHQAAGPVVVPGQSAELPLYDRDEPDQGPLAQGWPGAARAARRERHHPGRERAPPGAGRGCARPDPVAARPAPPAVPVALLRRVLGQERRGDARAAGGYGQGRLAPRARQAARGAGGSPWMSPATTSTPGSRNG